MKAQAGNVLTLYPGRPQDAGCNPWGRSAAPTPRSPSRRAPLPRQAGCLTLVSLDIGNRPSAPPDYRTPRSQSVPMPTPGAHEWEQADTRHLDDQSPRRPDRPIAQLHSPRDDASRRSAQMVMRLAVVPAVAVAVVLVCASVRPPEPAGAITAQPGRPSTARSSHAPGRPTNPLIRRKARPPRTAAAGGVYQSQAQPLDAAGTTRPAHFVIKTPASRTPATQSTGSAEHRRKRHFRRRHRDFHRTGSALSVSLRGSDLMLPCNP